MAIRTTILTALALASLLAPAEARACGPEPLPTHEFVLEQGLAGDGEAADTDAPAAPVVTAVRVERPEESGGCGGGSQSKCGGVSTLVVELEPPAGEPEGQIGWSFRAVEGAAADLPEGPVVPEGGGTRFAFAADDGPVDLLLAITAVDRAGNASAPTLIHVEVDGGTSGCSAAGAGPLAPWFGALAWLALRRRARGAAL